MCTYGDSKMATPKNLGPDDWLAEVTSLEDREIPDPIAELLLTMHSERYSVEYARAYLDLCLLMWEEGDVEHPLGPLEIAGILLLALVLDWRSYHDTTKTQPEKGQG
jgi:hypothetical protein